MNSLMGYGSDDDCDDSSAEKKTDRHGASKHRTTNKAADVNYEEVQMDLSEDSNESKPEPPRRSRDRDRKDDYRRRDDRTSRDKEGKSRSDDRYRRDRDRNRRPRKSTSRERRRSRTPKRESRYSKSRSRSRDRGRKYSRRYERSGSKERPNKSEEQREEKKGNSSQPGNNFFVPGISGRFRDQIERRKQLWQKKDSEEAKPDPTKKVWETTTFAQDSDGKVASKFKRLMGIKGNTSSGGSTTDVLKKQEEMFSSMEQQYEVARTATHTMRGVGLGFGSYQR